jgi:hypothetical protein
MRPLPQSHLACITHAILRTITYVKLKTYTRYFKDNHICKAENSGLKMCSVTQLGQCCTRGPLHTANGRPAADSRLTVHPFDCKSCVISLSVLPELARRIIRKTGGPIFKGSGAVSADFSVVKLCGTLGPTTNSVPKVIPTSHQHILVHLTLHSLAILARDPKHRTLTG